MAHRNVDAVKLLAVRASELAEKLEGPKFRPNFFEDLIIDFAKELEGQDSLLNEVYQVVKEHGFDDTRALAAARAAVDAANEHREK